MTSNVNAYISFGHLPPCSCVLECDYVAVSCRLLSSRCRFIFELRKMRFASSPFLILHDSKTQLILVNCHREDNLTITNNNFALQEEAEESKKVINMKLRQFTIFLPRRLIMLRNDNRARRNLKLNLEQWSDGLVGSDFLRRKDRATGESQAHYI